MFDTMTSTKIIGAFCGALLVFMLGKWAAEELYATGGGHGGEDHAAGYVIAVEEGDDASAEADDEPTFEELLASADPDKGERVFAKCRACHKLDEGEHGTGPSLYAVVGRDVGGVDGFEGYSGNLEQIGDTWTPENLDTFLENPRTATPGTSMSFAGLGKAEDRANLIAYLDTFGD
ncbi:MAG: cytochrome c [Rhodobacteraceae bacterium HLUCCO07]|nr:MAG: cytochrome c [Rhodobacteraceae bacterium HLUCCO07]